MNGYNAENADATPGGRKESLPLATTRPSIDFDRLLKLRLVVARFGEMDLAKWWNTKDSSAD